MDLAPLAFGMSGSLTINSGSGAKTGEFNAIQMLEDTAFTTLTDVKAASGGVTLAGITLPAGLTIFGSFTAVTVTSGTARCYKALPVTG